MTERLTGLSAADIDSLPFGYIALDLEGNIRRYNRHEADLAHKDPAEVLGKNFFREVAPCTQVEGFQGRFQQFASGEIPDPTLSFDFEFTFEHGSQKVRIGFVRSPLEREVIVTVNRIRDLALAMSPEITPEPTRGWLLDQQGRPVVAANSDFWLALEEMHGNLPAAQRRASMLRLGHEWGLRQALRVEHFIQKQYQRTLREVELQVALEALSGSLGALGLGRFDVYLGYRDRGLVVVHHQASPFAAVLTGLTTARCDLLSGLHAGFISYLSGRTLTAREFACSRAPGSPCRFVVGTERRLERLFNPAEGSADAALLLNLGIHREVPAEADHG